MIELPQCSALIIDKDGTITDSHAYWGYIIRERSSSIAAEARIADLSFVSKLACSMGWDNNARRLLSTGPIALKSRAEVIVEVEKFLKVEGVGQELDIGAIFDSVQRRVKGSLDSYIRPIPTAIEFIRRASDRGMRICVVSSDRRENINRAIDLCSVSEYIEFTIGGDEGFGSKEKGGPAIEACKRFGLERADVICIGDAEMDWKMKETAQLSDCILVSTGQTKHEDLSRIGDKVVKSLDQVVL